MTHVNYSLLDISILYHPIYIYIYIYVEGHDCNFIIFFFYFFYFQHSFHLTKHFSLSTLSHILIPILFSHSHFTIQFKWGFSVCFLHFLLQWRYVITPWIKSKLGEPHKCFFFVFFFNFCMLLFLWTVSQLFLSKFKNYSIKV